MSWHDGMQCGYLVYIHFIPDVLSCMIVFGLLWGKQIPAINWSPCSFAWSTSHSKGVSCCMTLGMSFLDVIMLHAFQHVDIVCMMNVDMHVHIIIECGHEHVHEH